MQPILRACLEVLKSTMDSKEVAHNFSSPWIPGCSHTLMVVFIVSASLELGFTENLFKISVILFDEKGIDLATWRGKKVAPFELLKKCKFILVPGFMFFCKKNRATFGLSWS